MRALALLGLAIRAGAQLQPRQDSTNDPLGIFARGGNDAEASLAPMAGAGAHAAAVFAAVTETLGPQCASGASSCFAKYCDRSGNRNAGLCSPGRCFGVCLEHNKLRWAASGLYNEGDACSSDSAEHSCKKCPAGRYTPATILHGFTECTACEPGKFQNEPGQSFCKPCPGGSERGATACAEASNPQPLPSATPPPCVESPWSGWSPCVLDCGKRADQKECTCSVFRTRVNIDMKAKVCPPAMQTTKCNGDAHHGCFDVHHAHRRAKRRRGKVGLDALGLECGAPPEVKFATFRSTGYKPGARAEYTCFDGYTLVDAAGKQSFSECVCKDAHCAWTNAPSCALQLQSPIGAVTRWTRSQYRGECSCDPRRHVATDVTCRLTDTAHFLGRNPLAAQEEWQQHRHIRVMHIHGAKLHRHHHCAVVPTYNENTPGSECKCCDCTRSVVSDNGCPCGAVETFFSRMWRMPGSQHWWTFKPEPRTTTCAVRGEVVREGLNAAAGVQGDIFAIGKLGIAHGRLSFVGAWTRPSERALCGFDGQQSVTADDAWRQLAAPGGGCGFMEFFIAKEKLEGSWRPKTWPKQESWDVDWEAPPVGDTPKCSASASSSVPSCASLRSNPLLSAPAGPHCNFLPEDYQFEYADSGKSAE